MPDRRTELARTITEGGDIAGKRLTIIEDVVTRSLFAEADLLPG